MTTVADDRDREQSRLCGRSHGPGRQLVSPASVRPPQNGTDRSSGQCEDSAASARCLLPGADQHRGGIRGLFSFRGPVAAVATNVQSAVPGEAVSGPGVSRRRPQHPKATTQPLPPTPAASVRPMGSWQLCRLGQRPGAQAVAVTPGSGLGAQAVASAAVPGVERCSSCGSAPEEVAHLPSFLRPQCLPKDSEAGSALCCFLSLPPPCKSPILAWALPNPQV
ncbi:uncharacterized protein LOC120615839 [Pteropus medius]|uniref:uncharacterized protein LOC120615839 n=1 Tax=Pteropus vampyrus TaxID=132908 RepID=UPI00196A7485|nr:uncharacterized protein LOC120615839 [Pteropus giganteus]